MAGLDGTVHYLPHSQEDSLKIGLTIRTNEKPEALRASSSHQLLPHLLNATPPGMSQAKISQRNRLQKQHLIMSTNERQLCKCSLKKRVPARVTNEPLQKGNRKRSTQAASALLPTEQHTAWWASHLQVYTVSPSSYLSKSLWTFPGSSGTEMGALPEGSLGAAHGTARDLSEGSR